MATMQPLLAETALFPLSPEILVPRQSVSLDKASPAPVRCGRGQEDRGLRRCGFWAAALGGAAWIRGSARRAVQRRARQNDALEAASPRRSALTFLGLTGFLAGGATARAEHLATLTADTLKDAAGKVVVITGATAGVGLEAARTLVAAGAEVYVTGRTLDKAKVAVAEITKEAGPGKAIPLELNLASLSSIRSFASQWSSEIKRPIDILACNAGLALGTDTKEPQLTADGYELTVGTNHLGHFLLVNLLEKQLAPMARIVVTASSVHNPKTGDPGAQATLGDLSGLYKFGKGASMVDGGAFDAQKAYKDSKLCNVFFTLELARRLKARGSAVTVNCFSPGLIPSPTFFRYQSSGFSSVFAFAASNVLKIAETTQFGGETLVFMALDPGLKGPLELEIRDNNNDPNSYTGFKVRCPAVDGNGCRQAALTESIETNVLTASDAGVYIERVDIGQTSSVLTFSDPINTLLTNDPEFGQDIITRLGQELMTRIDLDRIMVNGKSMTNALLTPTERHEANRLAGLYEFQDTFTKAAIETYQVGHRVMAQADSRQMLIPTGWTSTDSELQEFRKDSDEMPLKKLTFGPAHIESHWIRRNKLDSNEEIKGTETASNLKLCWGIWTNGAPKFYHEAGTVNFEDPPPMAEATVSLSTKMQEAVAPIIIAFKTTAGRSDYASPTGQTMLMLRFMDVSTKLEPFFYSTEQGIRGVYAMPDYQEVTKDQQKQHVCGKIFTEFWSSHSEGFPMPVGCYYSQKLSDLPTTGGSIFFREIYITFGERNGLRENTEYHIVLNAEIQFFNMGDQLVDIYAMCAGFTGCSRPYQVFEKGTATAATRFSHAPVLSNGKRHRA
eukprot:s512_g11.t1